jgi:hypothetical protein
MNLWLYAAAAALAPVAALIVWLHANFIEKNKVDSAEGRVETRRETHLGASSTSPDLAVEFSSGAFLMASEAKHRRADRGELLSAVTRLELQQIRAIRHVIDDALESQRALINTPLAAHEPAIRGMLTFSGNLTRATNVLSDADPKKLEMWSEWWEKTPGKSSLPAQPREP